MKILFLSTCYPQKDRPYNGIFIHRQAKALQELGVEVQIVQPVNWFPPLGLHVLHPYWKRGYNHLQQMEVEVEGIKIHHPTMFVKMPSRFFPEDGWERMGHSVGHYIKNHRELKNADWIYAHFLCHEGYAGVFASRLTGIPLAAIARGDDVHAWPEANPQLIKNLRLVFKEAKLLLANSKRLAEDTKQWFEEGMKRNIEVVYNGVDTSFFFPVSNQDGKKRLKEKFGLPSDVNLLMCVATPVVLKGWVELLDAIQQLDDQFAGWKLVGVTPAWKFKGALNLKGEAEKRGIQNHFIEKIGIAPLEMGELYRAMDAFILPSHNEGLSNAVIEAMATGLPVIATDVGGHNEFISHRKNGILIKPNNTNELIEALGKVVSTESYRSEIACNAREGAQLIGSYNDNAIKLKAAFESF